MNAIFFPIFLANENATLSWITYGKPSVKVSKINIARNYLLVVCRPRADHVITK